MYNGGVYNSYKYNSTLVAVPPTGSVTVAPYLLGKKKPFRLDFLELGINVIGTKRVPIDFNIDIIGTVSLLFKSSYVTKGTINEEIKFYLESIGIKSKPFTDLINVCGIKDEFISNSFITQGSKISNVDIDFSTIGIKYIKEFGLDIDTFADKMANINLDSFLTGTKIKEIFNGYLVEGTKQTHIDSKYFVEGKKDFSVLLNVLTNIE